MLTNNFILQITLPTFATLIDNMFLNYHEHLCISGNLKTYVSDHLSQFIIVDDKIEHRDYKNFNIDTSKRDIDEIDWSLVTGNTDINRL